MSAVFALVLSGLLGIGLMTLPLFVILGALAALWGSAKFFWLAEDVRSREEGRRTVIVALVAVFLSGALWAILDWADRTHTASTGSAEVKLELAPGE
jgi:peptidoglycan biosynthesis protein MviN/MurJ (putative lipid II flippase)